MIDAPGPPQPTFLESAQNCFLQMCRWEYGCIYSPWEDWWRTVDPEWFWGVVTQQPWFTHLPSYLEELRNFGGP